MIDARRKSPPERTLLWAAASIGPGSRVVSARRLPLGGWHANHVLTVIDRHGTANRLVLRRWARRGWAVEDPDFTAAREMAVLALLAAAPLPVPRLVAADPDGAVCDVPTLLLTQLPGHTAPVTLYWRLCRRYQPAASCPRSLGEHLPPAGDVPREDAIG